MRRLSSCPRRRASAESGAALIRRGRVAFCKLLHGRFVSWLRAPPRSPHVRAASPQDEVQSPVDHRCATARCDALAPCCFLQSSARYPSTVPEPVSATVYSRRFPSCDSSSMSLSLLAWPTGCDVGSPASPASNPAPAGWIANWRFSLEHDSAWVPVRQRRRSRNGIKNRSWRPTYGSIRGIAR